jgi:ATP-dependent Clp protease protease subunit
MKLITIENKMGKVRLDGDVDRSSMDLLIDKLATLYGDDSVRNKATVADVVAKADDAVNEIEIEIDSPGGSIQQGYRAYKTIMALRERGVFVTARVSKLAASMGSIIAAAADKVLIEENARIMIHDASVMAWGNPADLRETTERLDAISDELATMYSARTGQTPEEMRNLMKRETWLNADQAIEMKLADEKYKAEEKPTTRLDKLLGGERAEFDNQPKTNMSILAKLFPGNDQVAQLESSIEENESLRADLASATKQIEDFKNLTETNATLQAELKAEIDKTADFEAKAKEQADKIEALEKEAEVSVEKISNKASELLASQGHPEPVALTASDAPVDHIANLASLKGSERTVYFNENQAAIKAALSK